MRYTETQIEAMKMRTTVLPLDERVSVDTLFSGLELLRRHSQFSLANVLERHYGLIPAREPRCARSCMGLRGTCRHADGHAGDCEVVF